MMLKAQIQKLFLHYFPIYFGILLVTKVVTYYLNFYAQDNEGKRQLMS